MKYMIYLIVLAVLSAGVLGVPVKITGDGEAYGHHGNCYGWNSCGNAETCALWACQANGFQTLVSYGEERPCTQFGVCHLFNYQASVQCQWGNWCEVMGVTDIVCDDGEANLVCRQDLPPQDGSVDDEPVNSIPEFGIVAATGLLAAAGLFIYIKRR